MSVVRITDVERRAILDTRPMTPGADRTPKQREANRVIFRQIKSRYGVPSNTKIKVEIDSPGNPDYLVLKDKTTGRPFEDIYNRTGTPIKAAQPPWATAAAQANVRTVERQLEKANYAPAPAPRALELMTGRFGSIDLSDAQQLLRSEGDACDSYQEGIVGMPGIVHVSNGRLYFLV